MGVLSIVAVLANEALDPGPFAKRESVDKPSGPDVLALEPGHPVERQLRRGEEHRYLLALAAGEYARVTVEQQGIDVTVQLRGIDSTAIADFDDEILRPGREQVGVAADKAGTYTLAITAARGALVPGAYAIRVDARRGSTESDREMQESRRLQTTGARLEIEGRFEESRRSLELALGLTEAVGGPDHVQVAVVAAQLAGVYRRLAETPEAESLYRRAIAIMERTLGAQHPRTAFTQSQLAALYQRQGERRKAEALLEQAAHVIQHTLGEQHPWFVSCLTTQGNLLDNAGDLDEEETVVQRALSTMEHSDDTNNPQYAGLLNNLGEVYRQKQDYARAEALFQRSLGLSEKLLGPSSYSNATVLQNLGIIARERKDYATAVAYNSRALSIRERVVGTDHPDVAHILTNLANIYRATGDYRRSLETHLRALHIWENAAGPYQQATLLSVGNIAKTYTAMGDIPNAIAFQRRTDAIVEEQLGLNLAIGSERQKLVFVQGMSERTDRTISLHLRDAPGNAEASALAALVLLQRKGRVLDALIDTFAAVRQRIAKASDQSLLDRLNATTTELGRVALSTSGRQHAVARQNAIKDLESKKDRLETELADHSAEFRAEMQPVTLEAVQRAIPERSALLEFTIFRPFDPRAERNSEAYGPPHYAAYVVRPHAAPRGVDLGPTEPIDAAIDSLRQALRNPKRTDVKERARAVDARVMQPLRASFDGVTRLLISPDGELNLVPFEALVDEHGRYLIERYSTSYLTSGRDLLRMQATRAAHSAPVIFADPIFGEPATTSGRPQEDAVAPASHSVTTGKDLSAVYFAPLAATAEEARAIKALFPDATLFTGQQATKTALQHVKGPRMLHIATHGFFLRDAHLTVENPLLRSGLALAGANLTHDSPGSGMLTALEASGVNLWGTKLVTLSACDTGIGQVRNGEGVYGLRRAFVLAGAETVVMSLWAVSDTIARETMVSYYTGLRAGRGRGDALRHAKLWMLKRPGRQHPFYWASFIQSGAWTSLDGTS
jgi:CHAT domain-containing protein/Tfp pilus assembly protein PilF